MHEKKIDKKNLGIYGKYKVFSTFCGCGGLDLGFERAGFAIIGANEVDPNACRSYKLRFPRTNLVEKDIRIVPNKKFPKNIDILIGGYPCQGFSELSYQRLDDDRNFLYREFGRVLTAAQPKMFLAENVRGLVNMANGKVIKQMVKEFEEKNYKVQYRLLDAKDFGVPQTRTRVFIIGIRNDLDLEFNYPKKILLTFFK